MKRKTLIILIIAIIIIIALILGAYMLLGGGGGGGGGGTPTPTPSSSVTPTPTGSGVGTASSLQFSVDITHAGASQGSYTYYAKNAGTNNMMIRIDITGTTEGNIIYIVNGAQQKAWANVGGTWQDLSSTFSSQWDSWHNTFVDYQDSLAGWAGVGDYTYTAPNGDSVRIYSVSVNPSLADSLFQP